MPVGAEMQFMAIGAAEPAQMPGLRRSPARL